jgi:hypothetical protein
MPFRKRVPKCRFQRSYAMLARCVQLYRVSDAIKWTRHEKEYAVCFRICRSVSKSLKNLLAPDINTLGKSSLTRGNTHMCLEHSAVRQKRNLCVLRQLSCDRNERAVWRYAILLCSQLLEGQCTYSCTINTKHSPFIVFHRPPSSLLHFVTVTSITFLIRQLLITLCNTKRWHLCKWGLIFKYESNNTDNVRIT